MQVYVLGSPSQNGIWPKGKCTMPVFLEIHIELSLNEHKGWISKVKSTFSTKFRPSKRLKDSLGFSSEFNFMVNTKYDSSSF